MELRIEHEIAAPLARVEAALLGPSLLPRLPAFSASVAVARELTRRDRGDHVEREALYQAAFVPAALRAVIPRAWTTWIESTDWDRKRHCGQFRVEPQIPLRQRVTCRGCYELLPLADDRTLRRISGVLQIAAPGVGRRAEAVLARVIAEQFAGEAALLAVLAWAPA
jgi:hypothetical protein